jgi:imidazolonepropionase-like amidohydrolase
VGLGRDFLVFLLTAGALWAQPSLVSSLHGRRPARLLIRNAMVVEGVGTPAAGPRDILIEGNRIVQVGRFRQQADTVIDATGKFVLPGLINMHGHTHDERGGRAMDVNYVLKLWLACGITTVRDVGSDLEKTRNLRAKSAAGEIAAPRIFLYPFFSGVRTPQEARQKIQSLKAAGADGVKFLGVYRDVFEAAAEEIKAAGLGRAHHIGIEETNAWDDIRNGSPGTPKYYTIEHWYGIPDAALADGVQKFPPSYNYANEVDRFRHAGKLWREADPARLTKVLSAMVEARIAWDPTLNIYEASRDVSRAQNQPWFGEYLHPALQKFFEPSLESHGSYFFNWSTEDEIHWKENYRLWMNAVREFARLGGVVTTGEDAGYIYQMYGVGLLRELELQQEAGFHPLQVIAHATHNGARVLGKENEIGRVRAGWLADLLIVDGNPLANFKILFPVGPGGGKLEWTIKDGIPYHAPTLLGEVKEIVKRARAIR